MYDLFRDLSPVEVLPSFLRHFFQAGRQFRLEEAFPRGEGTSVLEEPLRADGVALEPLCFPHDETVLQRGDGEPVPGPLDRRLEHFREAHRPVGVQEVSQDRGRGGQGGGREPQKEGLFRDIRGRDSEGGPGGAVDGDRFPHVGQVEDRHGLPAEPRCLGLRDAQAESG